MTATAFEVSGRRCKVCGEPGHRADNARHTGVVKPSFALTSRAPKATGRRSPGRCNLCGSLDHDRKTCGEEPIVGSSPTPTVLPRWTPVNDTGAEDQGEAPAVARARARAAVGQDGRVRAKSISPVMQRKELRALALVVVPDDVPRPRTRGECAQVLRPCPFVSCSMHLFLDVNQESGTIKLNFPDKEPWEMEQTCALDVADAGATTLEAVGGLANITRERTRQIETRAIEKLRAASGDAIEPDTAGPQTFNRFAIEVP